MPSWFKIGALGLLPKLPIRNGPGGLRIYADPYSFLRHAFGASRVIEEPVTEDLVRRLQRDETFLDVGANVGTFTLLAARFAGTVVAVEAHPRTFSLLLRNIRLNNLKNVIPVCIAAGREEGTSRLYLHSYLDGYHSLLENQERGRFRTVRTTTLDRLVSELQLEGPMVVKVDVEGTELDVLEGAMRTLKLSREVIVEVHDSSVSPLIARKLEEADLAVSRISQRGTRYLRGSALDGSALTPDQWRVPGSDET